jgi:hypothetical protein
VLTVRDKEILDVRALWRIRMLGSGRHQFLDQEMLSFELTTAE